MRPQASEGETGPLSPCVARAQTLPVRGVAGRVNGRHVIIPPRCATHAKESSAGVERAPACFALDGSRLTLEALDRPLEGPVHLTVSEDVWAKVEAAAARIQQLCGGSQAVYGVNTGIGPLCRTRIPADQLQALQRNLILSHAVGVGPPAPPQVVRLDDAVEGLWTRARRQRHIASNTPNSHRPIESRRTAGHPHARFAGRQRRPRPLAHMVLPMIGEGQLQWRRITRAGEHRVEAVGLGGDETRTQGRTRG